MVSKVIRKRQQGYGALSIVVGADGRNSWWPKQSAPRNTMRAATACALLHLLEQPSNAGWFETYIRPNRGFAAAQTHDDLTMVVGGWPYSEFSTNSKDIEGNYLRLFDAVPAFAERVRGAKRETPFAGAPTPISFASRTVPVGRLSATRATSRIRSRRRESTMLSVTPSVAQTRWTNRSLAHCLSTRR